MTLLLSRNADYTGHLWVVKVFGRRISSNATVGCGSLFHLGLYLQLLSSLAMKTIFRFKIFNTPLGELTWSDEQGLAVLLIFHSSVFLMPLIFCSMCSLHPSTFFARNSFKSKVCSQILTWEWCSLCHAWSDQKHGHFTVTASSCSMILGSEVTHRRMCSGAVKKLCPKCVGITALQWIREHFVFA